MQTTYFPTNQYKSVNKLIACIFIASFNNDFVKLAGLIFIDSYTWNETKLLVKFDILNLVILSLLPFIMLTW